MNQKHMPLSTPFKLDQGFQINFEFAYLNVDAIEWNMVKAKGMVTSTVTVIVNIKSK